MTTGNKKQVLNPAIIALLYFLLGATWITFSDKLVSIIFRDPDLITKASMVKGWMYVLVTAIMLYALIKMMMNNLLHYKLLSDEKDRELVENARRLDFALQGANDGLWDVNVRSGQGYLSPRGYQILGYGPGEVPWGVKTWMQYLHPDDIAVTRESIAAHVEGKVPVYDVEHRFRTKTGEWKWVRSRGKIVERDEHGKPLRMTGTNTDVSYRKLIEIELIKTNHVYSVISHINQMVIRTREKNRIFSEACSIAVEYGKFRMAWIGLLDEDGSTVNPVAWDGAEEGYLKAIRNISLKNPGQGRGPTATAIRDGRHFGSEDIANDPRMAPWREEALKRGYRSSIALPIIVDGSSIGAFNIYASEPFFFNEREIMMLDEVAGNIAYAIEMIELEEKRKTAEDALRMSEATIRSVFRVAPVGIGILDNRIQKSVNKHWCELLGYMEDELLGRSTLMLFETAEEWERAGSKLYPGLYEKGMASTRSKMRRSDGSILDVLLMVAPIRNDDPSAGVVAIIHDITEMLELNASLEKRVAERTAELAVAKEHAEAADRIKSAFLATMSHELRTPLNSIIGFTGIILQELPGPLNDEQKKQVGIVKTSAQHLLSLINDVLDISKIEAGQFEIYMEPFDLRAVIDKAAAALKLQAEKKGLSLDVLIPEDIGEARGDARRVEQVLLNLLSNAVKFTEHGSIKLAADIIDSYKPPGTGGPANPVEAVRFSVADTGIGIEPGELGKLFQPFHQIDTGLARKNEGTGLGLAICRRLADLMGGEIKAESEWGMGSTFTFTIPLKGRDM